VCSKFGRGLSVGMHPRSVVILLKEMVTSMLILGILRTVESAKEARMLPCRLNTRLFYVLMAIACHACENTYAVLSTNL
jgi:hypothetical protein